MYSGISSGGKIWTILHKILEKAVSQKVIQEIHIKNHIIKAMNKLGYNFGYQGEGEIFLSLEFSFHPCVKNKANLI